MKRMHSLVGQFSKVNHIWTKASNPSTGRSPLFRRVSLAVVLSSAVGAGAGAGLIGFCTANSANYFPISKCDQVDNSKKMSDDDIPGLYSQDRLRSMSINIGGMRIPYLGKGEAFTEDQLVAKEPFAQFNNWFERAAITQGIEEPNAMCLATTSKDGKPSCRMVLLKGYGIDGFKFCTNYSSRKGKEIEENPYVALNFYWEPMKRCVRIEGRVEKLSTEESIEYFNSRPISSRIGAAISPQSQPVPGRKFLTDREEKLTAQVGTTGIVEKPDNWGGYVVTPDIIEFWQGQTTRIHDRIRFRKRQPGECPDNIVVHEGDNGWVYERLAP